MVTNRQMDEVTRRIAYKLAKDYDLSERSFAICYSYNIRKYGDYTIASGGIIRVYFTHTPKYPEYESMMRRCLQQVAFCKKTRFTGIVVYGGSGHPASLGDFGKEWRDLPKLLPFEEIEFSTLYKVEMKHYATGLTVKREGKIGKRGVTVSRLMIDARVELSELVASLLKSQGEPNVEKKPATINRDASTRNENGV